MRFALLFSAIVLPLTLASPLVQRAASDPLPNPNNDTFYDAPSNLASFKEGQVIRHRQVDVSFDTSDLDSAHQLLYSTHDTQLKEEVTVATVFIPKKPASPSRILSVQIYEDSVTFDCTPSYAFTKGTKSAAIFSTNFLDTPIYMAWALSQGYYVVAADHEGRHSQFIAGYAAGMRVLDGVRALTNFKKLSSPQVAFVGYSGGAHATAWATQVAETYAKEINIVGAAYGGTPVDTKGSFDYINGGLFAGFAGAGVLGLMKAYPDLSDFVYSHLSDDGNKALEKAQGPNFCIGSVATGFPFTDFFKYINVTDPLSQPVAKKVLQSETLLKSASSNPDAIAVPKYPRLVLHSLLDEIIPYNDTKVYVQEQCDAGADISFNTFPISEHVTGLIFSIVPSIAFLKDAFQGKAPKVKCGTSTPALPNLFSPQAKDLIGADNVQKLLSSNNTKSAFGEIIHL